VLLDYNLPKANGAQIAQTLRTLENAAHRSIIIGITGQVDHAILQQCLAAGMDKVFSKPLPVSVLKNIISA
jgi:two-component system, OmpR family, aerobic respiration control sensor histidine kinase ArcB